MQIINNKIYADDGMMLTNGEAFGTNVHLAKEANVSDWWEITEAEAEILRRDMEEAQEEDYERYLAELGVVFDAE